MGGWMSSGTSRRICACAAVPRVSAAKMTASHVKHCRAFITHRGKPPAPPGDSPRFDLYDGPREFLISAKRKEIHDERVPEPEPYEMGLQISRGVYSEA